jgi:hypothetical protein
MEKCVRDDKVAVVFAGRHGIGWYSQDLNNPEIVFDPNIVQHIESQEFSRLKVYMELRYPHVYISDDLLQNLEIMWLPEGTEFKIDEYDGLEHIVLRKKVVWLKA